MEERWLAGAGTRIDSAPKMPYGGLLRNVIRSTEDGGQ